MNTERIKYKLNVVRERDKVNVEEEWLMFKSTIVGCTEKVCGMRRVGGRLTKRSQWWCKAVKLAAAEKMHAHGLWLQRNDEVSFERYKEKINQAKRVVRVANVSLDERCGSKMTKNIHENEMF